MLLTEGTAHLAADMARLDAEVYRDGDIVHCDGSGAIAPKSRADWLMARRHFVGASETAALAGMNEHFGALQVYESKITGEPIEPSLLMRNGLRLEDDVLEIFADMSGLPVFTPRAAVDLPVIYHRAETPFAAATPDGFVIDRDELGGVQIKCRTPRKWKQYDTDITRAEWVQVQHEMMITGCKFSYVVIFLHVGDIRFARVEADEDAHADIMTLIAEFWECVKERRAPEFSDGLPATHKAISRLYPKPTPGAISVLPQRFRELHARREQALETIRQAEREKKAIDAQLKFEIADNEIGVLDDGSAAYRWGLIERKEAVQSASTYRALKPCAVPERWGPAPNA